MSPVTLPSISTQIPSRIELDQSSTHTAEAESLISKVISAVKHIFTSIKNMFADLSTYLSKTLSALFSKAEAPAAKPAKFEGTHIKAIEEKPTCYPDRAEVPEDCVSWAVSFPSYSPVYFVAKPVTDNAQKFAIGTPERWADPEDFSLVKGKNFFSHQATVRLDEEGKPLNPCGRTGIIGRGLLGKWGANQAGDPVVTRINPETQALEMLVIQRKDNGQWAIPGGMQDEGELVSKTCKRELGEETSADVDFDSAPIIYQGYVDDSRNTDNSWMETSVIHVHLTQEMAEKQAIEANDDAAAAKWVPITPDFVKTLFASHPLFAKLTIEHLDAKIIEQCSNKAELLAIKNG